MSARPILVAPLTWEAPLPPRTRAPLSRRSLAVTVQAAVAWLGEGSQQAAPGHPRVLLPHQPGTSRGTPAPWCRPLAAGPARASRAVGTAVTRPRRAGSLRTKQPPRLPLPGPGGGCGPDWGGAPAGWCLHALVQPGAVARLSLGASVSQACVTRLLQLVACGSRDGPFTAPGGRANPPLKALGVDTRAAPRLAPGALVSPRAPGLTAAVSPASAVSASARPGVSVFFSYSDPSRWFGTQCSPLPNYVLSLSSRNDTGGLGSCCPIGLGKLCF